ncbi:MAG: universal stress protein, partial [Candidatus Obscuribacterales bacterium]|nr:universal stress protein [Candidatus Obscuribacterales bacterium]
MNVLIALDSSASTHAALAATLARRWPEGTDFRVSTVIPGKSQDKINCGEFGAELFHAHRLIDRAISEIKSRNEDSIVMGEIDVGNPTKAILRLADSWPADLIVVGPHDRALLQRLYMGSVSRSVLHKA